MPTVVLTPISKAAQPYTKLDPRLAALLELDDAVFEPADTVAPVDSVDTVAQATPATPVSEGHESLRGAPSGSTFRQRRDGPLAFLTGPRRFAGTFEPVRGGGDEAAIFSSVAVFVTARSAERLDPIGWRAGGLEWRSKAGRVGTTNVNPAQLAVLEEDDDVVAVEWTGGAKPLGLFGRGRGVSPRPAVGLAAAAGGPRGCGVVVGIVDIDGIDLYHPAFTTERGRNRILALWDQERPARPAGPGAAPLPYGYGVSYTPVDIFRELDCDNRDRYSIVEHTPLKLSHGTMVAGLAAGGGREDAEMAGVAPDADIVFVSTPASNAGALAAMTEVAEAVDFVFRQAGDRPCVVNLSLGDELGPRDGTSPVERFLDELLAEKPGRAVVVAAGNEGEAGTHASGVASSRGPVTLLCEAWRPSGQHAVIEIWYGGVRDEEAGISLQIESPDGRCATPPIAADGLGRAFDLGETRLIVASVKRYPGNGDALIRVEMFPRSRGGAMDTGEYKLSLSGDEVSRPFHAWLDHTCFKLRAGETAAPGASDAEASVRAITLTSPATCRSAVTVGACHHDTGLVAPFTSLGPDRRGGDKPDVFACGVTLRAPAAATMERCYHTFTGTSAAAPLVTGAIALAFEHALARGARLTGEQTRAFVRAASPGEGRRLMLPPDGRLDAVFASAGITLPEAGEGPAKQTDSALPRAGRETPMKKENQGETMSTQDTKATRSPRDLVREKDGKQLGIGYFTLHQNGIQTGRVLVVQDGSLLVEHYDLWQAFRQPSWGNTSQEIVFDYVGEPINLGTFTGEIGQNSTYIVARCEQVFL